MWTFRAYTEIRRKWKQLAARLSLRRPHRLIIDASNRIGVDSAANVTHTHTHTHRQRHFYRPFINIFSAVALTN